MSQVSSRKRLIGKVWGYGRIALSKSTTGPTPSTAALTFAYCRITYWRIQELKNQCHPLNTWPMSPELLFSTHTQITEQRSWRNVEQVLSANNNVCSSSYMATLQQCGCYVILCYSWYVPGWRINASKAPNREWPIWIWWTHDHLSAVALITPTDFWGDSQLGVYASNLFIPYLA